jgi:hypothetical protein
MMFLGGRTFHILIVESRLCERVRNAELLTICELDTLTVSFVSSVKLRLRMKKSLPLRRARLPGKVYTSITPFYKNRVERHS